MEWRQVLLFISVLYSTNACIAQEKVTAFGFQFKPMIGGGLINEGDPSNTEDGVDFAFDKKFGFSAGMVIRKGFTKMFSLETGLGFVQRNFDLRVQDDSQEYSYIQEFGVVGYELPVLGLVYIQLSKQAFMDASFGMAFDFFPSDVAVISDDNRVVMESRRTSWVQPALTANIGWEWRSKKNGTFYVGGTYHRTFGESFAFLTGYEYDAKNISSSETRSLIKVNGNYVTLDFRYFFHEDAETKRLRRENKSKNRKR